MLLQDYTILDVIVLTLLLLLWMWGLFDASRLKTDTKIRLTNLTYELEEQRILINKLRKDHDQLLTKVNKEQQITRLELTKDVPEEVNSTMIAYLRNGIGIIDPSTSETLVPHNLNNGSNK